MGAMCDSTRRELGALAALFLQNEQSFVVRRSIQRFLAGEITAQDAIRRIREQPDVRDEDSPAEAF